MPGSPAFILSQRVASLSRDNRRHRASARDTRRMARPAQAGRTARPERPKRLRRSSIPECVARTDPPRFRRDEATTRDTTLAVGDIFRRLRGATTLARGYWFHDNGRGHACSQRILQPRGHHCRARRRIPPVLARGRLSHRGRLLVGVERGPRWAPAFPWGRTRPTSQWGADKSCGLAVTRALGREICRPPRPPTCRRRCIGERAGGHDPLPARARRRLDDASMRTRAHWAVWPRG